MTRVKPRLAGIVFLLFCLALGAAAPLAQPIQVIGTVDHVDCGAFTHDGKLLIASDQMILEYDLESTLLEQVHRVSQARTLSIVCFPGDDRVAMTSTDGRLLVWSRGNGEVLGSYFFGPVRFFGREYYPSSNPRPMVAVSPDGFLIALVVPREFAWNWEPSLALLTTDPLSLASLQTGMDHSAVCSPAFSPNSKVLYAAVGERLIPNPDYAGTTLLSDLEMGIEKWDLESGESALLASPHLPGHVSALAASGSVLRYAMGYHRGWECVRRTCTPSLECPVLVGWIDERVVDSASGTLSQWSSWDEIVFFGGGGCKTPVVYQGRDAHLSPNGKWMVEGFRLLDVETGKALIDDHELLHFIDFSPDGDLLAFRRVGEVELRACESGSLLRILPENGIYSKAAISFPSGTIIGLSGDQIAARELLTGQIEAVHSIDPCSVQIHESIVSPQGSYYVAFGNRGAYLTRVRDVEDELAFLAPDPTGMITSSSINPSEDRLLLTSGMLYEYAIDTTETSQTTFLRTIAPALNPGLRYAAAAYSTDGGHIVAATDDSSAPEVHIFNAVDGDLETTRSLSKRWRGLQFDPSGRYIAALTQTETELYTAGSLEKLEYFSASNWVHAFAFNGDILLSGVQKWGATFVSIRDTSNGCEIGAVIQSFGTELRSIIPSPDPAIVYTTSSYGLTKWYLPIEELIANPLPFHRDHLLGKEPVIVSGDRNGDGVRDVADMLLAARSME